MCVHSSRGCTRQLAATDTAGTAFGRYRMINIYDIYSFRSLPKDQMLKVSPTPIAPIDVSSSGRPQGFSMLDVSRYCPPRGKCTLHRI